MEINGIPVTTPEDKVRRQVILMYFDSGVHLGSHESTRLLYESIYSAMLRMVEDVDGETIKVIR